MVSRWYFPCMTSLCFVGREAGERRFLWGAREEPRPAWELSSQCAFQTRATTGPRDCKCTAAGPVLLSSISLNQREKLMCPCANSFHISLFSWFTRWLTSAFTGRGRFQMMMIVGSASSNSFSIISAGWRTKADPVTFLTYIVLHGKSFNIRVAASLQLDPGTLSFMSNRFCTAAVSTWHLSSVRDPEDFKTELSWSSTTCSCVAYAT